MNFGSFVLRLSFVVICGTQLTLAQSQAAPSFSELKRRVQSTEAHLQAELLPDLIYIALAPDEPGSWGDKTFEVSLLIEEILNRAPRERIEEKLRDALPAIKANLNIEKPTTKTHRTNISRDRGHKDAWARPVWKAMQIIRILRTTFGIREVIPDLVEIATEAKHPNKHEALANLATLGAIGLRGSYGAPGVEVESSLDEASLAGWSKETIEKELLIREAQKRLLESRAKELIEEYEFSEKKGYLDQFSRPWQIRISEVRMTLAQSVDRVNKEIERLRVELKTEDQVMNEDCLSNPKSELMTRVGVQ